MGPIITSSKKFMLCQPLLYLEKLKDTSSHQTVKYFHYRVFLLDKFIEILKLMGMIESFSDNIDSVPRQLCLVMEVGGILCSLKVPKRNADVESKSF